MEKILANIEKYVLLGTILLFPLFVVSTSPNPFVVPKLTFLVTAISYLLVSKAVRVVLSGKLNLSVGKFDLSIVIILLSYLVSTYFRTPDKSEALVLPGTTTIIAAATLLYFLVNQLKEEGKEMVTSMLFLSGVIYSVVSLLAFTGLFENVPQLPAYYRSKLFTPEGGYLPTIIFLSAILPIGIAKLIGSSDINKKILNGVSLVIIGGTLAISIFNVLPGKASSPRFVDMNQSWTVAIDSLKTSPLMGMGPGNYLTAFNRFRTIEFNASDLWAVKYATGSNFYITHLTETGLLGLAGLIMLLIGYYNFAKKEMKERKLVNWGFTGTANLISLVILLVLFAIFPVTLTPIVILFILFAVNSKSHPTTLNLLTVPAHEGQTANMVAARFPALLIALPVIILVVFLDFRAFRMVLAEYRFTKALNFLVANDAEKTYDTMRSAIALNPRVARYHTTFSRVNFAIANSLAQKAGKAENGLTDPERQQITVLVQQTINEAKSAVALNPLRAGNWEILGRTYQSIIPLAQGADNFAIQSLTQAVVLDPLNPNLRIALGGLYFGKKDYDNAIRVFELAVATKPDLANSHYNLAYAYKEKGRFDEAAQQMTLVLSIVDKSSSDYEVAKKALEDIEEKRKSVAPTGEGLTPPQAEPTPAITPKVELTEDQKPPVTPQVTPTVTVTPTAAPAE